VPQLTSKEQHPDFPGQYFIIGYISAAKRQKLNEALEPAAFPVAVIDPSTGKAYLDDKGEIRTQTKVVFTDAMRLERLLVWFKGWCDAEGKPVVDLGDGPVEFNAGNYDDIREVLYDDRLNVKRIEDVEKYDAQGRIVRDEGAIVTEKKEVTRTWLYVLSEKAALRSTFIPAPPSTTSATS
jgi:hypothetical protein